MSPPKLTTIVNIFSQKCYKGLKGDIGLMLYIKSSVVFVYRYLYIGPTKQYLRKRCSEHKNSIKTNKPETFKTNISSALVKHSLQLHQFHVNNVKVLTTEIDYHTRMILVLPRGLWLI